MGGYPDAFDFERLAAALACAVMTATPVLAFRGDREDPGGHRAADAPGGEAVEQDLVRGRQVRGQPGRGRAAGDGTILKKGYRGVGEIHPPEEERDDGQVGRDERAADLSAGRRGAHPAARRKGVEGKGNTGNQIVGVVLIVVFAAVIKGHNVDLAQGARSWPTPTRTPS
jgi:hypothetical protein